MNRHCFYDHIIWGYLCVFEEGYSRVTFRRICNRNLDLLHEYKLLCHNRVLLPRLESNGTESGEMILLSASLLPIIHQSYNISSVVGLSGFDSKSDIVITASVSSYINLLWLRRTLHWNREASFKIIGSSWLKLLLIYWVD